MKERKRHSFNLTYESDVVSSVLSDEKNEGNIESYTQIGKRTSSRLFIVMLVLLLLAMLGIVGIAWIANQDCGCSLNMIFSLLLENDG